MYMLAHECSNGGSDCKQQSLAAHFADKMETDADKKNTPKEKSAKQKAKEHLSKFLDATRSDMLFADKVILVEGIAERLARLPVVGKLAASRMTTGAGFEFAAAFAREGANCIAGLRVERPVHALSLVQFDDQAFIGT